MGLDKLRKILWAVGIIHSVRIEDLKEEIEGKVTEWMEEIQAVGKIEVVLKEDKLGRCWVEFDFWEGRFQIRSDYDPLALALASRAIHPAWLKTFIELTLFTSNFDKVCEELKAHVDTPSLMRLAERIGLPEVKAKLFAECLVRHVNREEGGKNSNSG